MTMDVESHQDRLLLPLFSHLHSLLLLLIHMMRGRAEPGGEGGEGRKIRFTIMITNSSFLLLFVVSLSSLPAKCEYICLHTREMSSVVPFLMLEVMLLSFRTKCVSLIIG